MDILIDAQIRDYCERLSNISESWQHVERSTYLQTIKPFDASDPIQAKLLALLSHLIAPKLIVELGTFSAYAAISMMDGLAADGRIITIEHTTALTPLIESHIDHAAASDKIEVKYGDALEQLSEIDLPIDMVFIDAAKRQYEAYFDAVIDRVRPGGLIIADNVLWKNEVINTNRNKMAEALHQFNEKVAADDRVDTFILPYRDGLSISRRL